MSEAGPIHYGAVDSSLVVPHSSFKKTMRRCNGELFARASAQQSVGDYDDGQ
ncbi:MAG TPA: hypothetical protein VGG64_13905 [Pirellulales bacterium]